MIRPWRRSPGGDPARLEECWSALTPGVQGQIIDQLMVVTVNSIGSKTGVRAFDPRYIDIAWKRA